MEQTKRAGNFRGFFIVKMKKVKRVIAPVRIDFAGGTTDIQPFPEKYGGCVLNASINKYIKGSLIAEKNKVGLKYEGNIPTSSGLGTSGTMNVVLTALITKLEKEKLAEKAFEIENLLIVNGGKQDQYSAVFGGINLWKFEKNKVIREKVKVKKKTIKKLENNLLIVYVGSHSSGNANKKMIDNLEKGKNIEQLKNIKKIALDMKKCLEKDNLEKFASLMNKETENREKLAKNIVGKKEKKMIKKGLKISKAVKILGAGSGGSLLFYGNKKELKKKFKNTIDFKFDFKGLRKI